MRKKIAGLDCLVREGENERDVLIPLHGFGANAADLFPLADMLDPDGHWTIVVPNAPLEVAIGGGFSGKAWFPISLRDLEGGVDFTQIRPPGIDAAAGKVNDLIFELNPERLVLGGFSQGAMLATEVALKSPDDLQSLVILSGVMLDQPNWKRLAAGLKGKKILQSHGTRDQVLPITAADSLFQMLKEAGADIEFLRFGGGHEIPMPVIAKVAALLKDH